MLRAFHAGQQIIFRFFDRAARATSKQPADLNARMLSLAHGSKFALVLILAATPRSNQKAVLTRDEFSRLYESAYRTLVVVAMAQVGRSHAEDVVQQAGITAWQQRSRFTVGTDFNAWMAAMVRGVARNHRRGERRRTDRHRALAEQAAERSPEQAGEARDDVDLLVAIDELSEAQRECFLLRALLDKTYDQISAIMQIPAATARTHVYRARQQLAAALAREAVDRA